MLTDAQAAILTRMAVGATLAHSLQGERLWSLLEDPFTVFDDVSPRVLLAGGFIALAQRGSVKADRADAYRLTIAGHAALRDWRLRMLMPE
ncbi:hypothetical protein [Lichenifustis flavocetrariae]|uniref:Uncharacterized protein n=1 Tax=Lichenifustis flavocetrariae TaxID=2949735 RepID=A0AA42CMM5_9HYPH|nr:hypothetical protein [Lichenifustis flavocetrariae]MCW6512844.1 hypothetical protein [Lichenifustis flavocetrariae]